MKKTIKLQINSVLQIPFQKYEKDFTFIVNSKRYETSSFIADLLSPIISSRHFNDPTLNEFVINTEISGDFNNVIALINFEEQEFSDDDYLFIIEVFEKLGIEKVDFKNNEEKITNENIFNFIKVHQKYPKIFKNQLENEIEYFSSHFSELKENLFKLIDEEKLEINEDIIESIISNEKLLLDTEDDLLEMVNKLYLKNTKYSHFYEFVDFINIKIENMKEFIQIFDVNDFNKSIWSSIVCRLLQPILIDKDNNYTKHSYKKEKVN